MSVEGQDGGALDAGAVAEAVDSKIESSEMEETEVSDIGESEEVSEEVSGDEPSDSEVEAAAKKIKAKEVKGSDGERFKIKVDGQELEYSREEMTRLAQYGKAGQKAMQEKAELQKHTAQFIKALQDDPKSVLMDEAILGSREKLIEFAQNILSEQLEEEQLSPEQKELREAKSELEKYRKEQKESEEKRKNDEYESQVKEYEDELQIKVQEALEAENLPRKPAILNKMADILLTAHDNKLKVTPRQAAKLAKDELMSDIKGLAEVLDDDQMEQLFGSEVITRMRKASMKRVKPAVPTVKVDSTGKGIGDLKKKEQPKIEMKDFMRSAIYGKK